MDFVDALRQRLVAQAELFAGLSSHTTITGTGRERALADLLREVLPRRLEVLSGVVARTDGGAPAKSARQVDLLIVDTHDFPVLARSGDLAVVLPDSVRAMVEIKTRVSGEAELREAIGQLAESRSECTTGQSWYSALFSYTYPESSEKLREGLAGLIATREENKIKLLDRGLPPERWKELEAQVSLLSAPYLPDLIVSEKGAIAAKMQGVYRFFRCDDGHAAVVLLCEILTAVTAETMPGALGPALVGALRSALQSHAMFLQANKTHVLKDLAI